MALAESLRAAANVREVIDASLKCLARDPAQDGVSVEVRVAPDLAAAIRPMALQQVFMNLILNAIRAMKTAKGSARAEPTNRVTVTAGPDPGSGMVRIEVTDTGPGFSTEVAQTMFDPFVTTGARSKGPAGGTGLGLAVCKRLITEAGGGITAHSEPGRGATFSIVLPAASSGLRAAGLMRTRTRPLSIAHCRRQGQPPKTRSRWAAIRRSSAGTPATTDRLTKARRPAELPENDGVLHLVI